MNREIFTTIKLSNGDLVTILKIIGIDAFNAMRAIKHPNDASAFGFFLLCECALVNGKKVEMKYLHSLDFEDALILIEAINAQTTKVKI